MQRHHGGLARLHRGNLNNGCVTAVALLLTIGSGPAQCLLRTYSGWLALMAVLAKQVLLETTAVVCLVVCLPPYRRREFRRE